ncbi:error-prone DNA polymerase [Rhizobium sp. TRM96647]|uniref:error-prone DNA polymerase n=1 Tax=unclassified Rhizobium TaxID=2613769 RepID=UPI0021E7880C|nr:MULTISPECIES: error-prone DNA polymerase [unclassified Rhizobium]MCV3734952.1 error-prone DNA polymerase [Rhizobium sp. TRM96647]MCV3757322.1 error-prone DNA polymerase [Rhizobium sp. TRM96650]
MSTAPAFYEFGARTNFSFLEGAASAEAMVETARRIGLAGLGIADRNTVAGVVRAHSKARFEKYAAFRPGARLVFADGTPDILAYPQNRRGWAHLCRLLSTGNLRARKGECTLFLADLLEWQAELQLIIMPAAGRPEADRLKGLLARLREPAGDRLYLALVPRRDGFDRHDLAVLAQLAEQARIRTIASNDPLYDVAESRPLADVVTAIRRKKTIAALGFQRQANAERGLKGHAEMARLMRDHPEAIANTQRFFSGLAFDLEELSHQYPDESDEGSTPAETLLRLVREGGARRYPCGIPGAVEERLSYELALIGRKRYEPYFLTVHKLVSFARSRGILCQGRGSAANSSVCYCLGITEVDPDQFTLLFDRFLSEDRDEPPDIDVDFEHERRQEVIDYIYRTYGKEHAGLAAAVISYRGRSAGREVAKAFGLSDDVQSALSGSIWGWGRSTFSVEQVKAAGLDTGDPTTDKVLTCARRLLEFPRHLSQHVGGFLITRDRLDEVVPIMPTAMPDRYMVEWDKDDLDTLKLLKVDVLALGMLTCIAKAFKFLESHYDEPKTLAEIYVDDRPEVYDMICRADTLGVFQIESRAQMSMLPRLKPRRFYDLVIEVAIVRPGPIQGNMVHPYLKRREGKEKVVYPKEEIRAVLERTLGVPLFQEQAMQIAMTAAGFSAPQADKLRRAMATFRRTGQVSNFRQQMVDGMLAKGYTREFAERCFSQIEGFGEYGFPESHAASFALLVYASSWLKAYYPDVFCAAILNAQPMGFYAPAQLVRDAREHGVCVRAVDVNHSDWDCTLEGDAAFDRTAIAPRHRQLHDVIKSQKAVRLGFRLVKGLSKEDMAALVAKRGEGYRSVHDLWLRSGLPRSTLERLADADAFRSMNLDRRTALWAVKALDETGGSDALPLFERAGADELRPEPQVSLPAMPAGEHVLNDYRYLTLSLKAHPVSFMRADFTRQGIMRNDALETAPRGDRVTVAGLVLVRQQPGSAKGVIFMTIEDETGIANIIIWKKTMEKYRRVVMGARLVRVRGRLQRESDVIHVVAEHMEDWTHALGLLKSELRSFATMSRADEILHPVNEEAREKRALRQLRLAGRKASWTRDMQTELRRDADVIPKGRNFQ